jgi:glycerol uptake facilitator-like aquaporin
MTMKNMQFSVIRWFGAELVGTFFLAATAVVAGTAQLGGFSAYSSLYVPFMVGGLVMLMVYLLGSVSGAHLNPAVVILNCTP